MSALLLGLLCLPGQSLGGAIKGKVVFVGATPAPKMIDVTIDQYLCGAQKDAEDLVLSPKKEIRNTVVWLENPPPNAAWPTQAKRWRWIRRGACTYPEWMVSWVVVAAHPYYAVTGADGQFAFDNLPPGQYKLQVWHERLGTVPANVTVGDQQLARVTVEMKAP